MTGKIRQTHARLKMAKLLNLANYASTFLLNDLGSWPALLPRERLLSFKRVLFLAPHQDDEAFSLGGTLSLLDDGGSARLGFVWFSRGENAIRTAEARAFMDRLPSARGNLEVEPFPFPDESVPVGRSNRHLQALLRQVGPDLVCVPSIFDAHIDHLRLNVALQKAVAATRWAGTVMQYEVWNTLVPNFVVDISPVRERKEALMRVFRSQLNEANRNYIERIQSLNRYRGMPFQIDAGEGILLSSSETFLGFSAIRRLLPGDPTQD